VHDLLQALRNNCVNLWPVTGDLSGAHLRLSWNCILSIQIKYSFITANTIILSIKKIENVN
jgi:hypothetical protein